MGWIASPCTSCCGWQLKNGGTRTWDNPQGTGQGPLKDTEALGNALSRFSAQYFEGMLDSGGFPVVGPKWEISQAVEPPRVAENFGQG